MPRETPQEAQGRQADRDDGHFSHVAELRQNRDRRQHHAPRKTVRRFLRAWAEPLEEAPGDEG